jgi:2-polyprenyl-6-methoxyphenol hydroxylase-like FAD-dependent oxidoreductase
MLLFGLRRNVEITSAFRYKKGARHNTNEEPLPARKRRRMTTMSFSLFSSSSSRCSSSSRTFSSKRHHHQQQQQQRHLGKRRQRRLLRARERTDDNDDDKEKEQERNTNEDDLYSVCVLGAGPAGLTTALAMQKMLSLGTTTKPPLSKLKITVLDKNPNALDGNLGGGFNINGGAAVLEKLGVYEEVFSKNANKLRAVLSRRCDIDRTRLFEVDIEKEVRGDFLTNAKELLVNEERGEVMAGTVMRADLSKSLRESLNEETCEVVLGCEVIGVDAESGEVELRRRDGTTTETRKFDLIVGADGIDSLARKCVVESNASSGDGSSSGSSSNSSRSGGSSTSGRKEPIYSGIKILFGVTGVDDEPEDLIRELSDRTTAHQWFGDGAYSLVFTGGGENKKRHNLAFCSNEPLGSANSNPSWRANSSVTKEYAHNKMMKANMPADVLRLCLRCERFFEIGVFFHEPLDSWSTSNGKVVLVGDAAHAMPPFLGQGANQAMQDAYVLAKCLATCGADIKNPSKVNEALQSYSNTRRPPTEAIMNASRFVGALETGKGPVSLFRDLAFFVAGKFGVTGKIFLSGATPRL